MFKFFISMTGNPFKKTHVTWSLYSGEETADGLPQDTIMWVVGSGKDTVRSQPIDTLPDPARSLKIPITGECFWEQGPTFPTHLSPSLM